MSDHLRLKLDEVFFNDAATFDGRALFCPETTWRQADTQRRGLCTSLLTSPVASERCREVALKLHGCRSDMRCFSGACPVCSRAVQRWLTWAVPQALDTADGSDTNGWCFTTVIPTDFGPPGVETFTGSPEVASSRILRSLEVAGTSSAIGSIDVSYNEWREDGSTVVHRCAHAHLLVPAEATARWKKRLKAVFPATPHVPRPVRIELWDEEPAAIAYGFRYDLSRRVYSGTADENAIPRPIVRCRELRVAQRVEAALLLDELGLVGRLLLVNFVINNDVSPPLIRRVGSS